MSAIIDTISVGGGPAGLSAALLLVRCLNNVVVCDVGHPRNEPSRIFKGYLSATVHASNLAITRLYPCDSQWSPTLCGAKGEFMAILESGERLSARTILIATDLVDERPQIENLRRLYAKNAQNCPYCDDWELDVSRSRCSAKPRTRPSSQSSWCSAVRRSFFAPTRSPLATTKTKKEVARSGADFDRAYLKQSGVEGPSGAEREMDKVQSKAADATLKTIAATALPLIKTHLQVSQDEMKDLG